MNKQKLFLGSALIGFLFSLNINHSEARNLVSKRSGSVNSNSRGMRADGITTDQIIPTIEKKVETKSLATCFKSYKGCMDGRASALLSMFPDFLQVSQNMTLKFYSESKPPQFRCIFDKNSRNIYLNKYYNNTSSSSDEAAKPKKGAINYYQSLLDQMDAFNTGKMSIENLSKYIFKDLRLKQPKINDEIDLEGITLRIKDLDFEKEYEISESFCSNLENATSGMTAECEDYIYTMKNIYLDTDGEENSIKDLAEEDLNFISVAQSCKDFSTFSKEKVVDLKNDYKRALKANKASIKKKLERYNNSL